MRSTFNNSVLENIFVAVEKTTYVGELPLACSTRIVDDLGLGDFGRFRLTLALEETFNFEFSNEDVRRFVTLGDIAAFLSHRCPMPDEHAESRLAA